MKFISGKFTALKTENQELREDLLAARTALNFIAFYSARRGVRTPNGSTKVIERVAEAALAGRSIAEAAARLNPTR